MTPNLDDKQSNKRVMSREKLLDNEKARNLSFERQQLM